MNRRVEQCLAHVREAEEHANQAVDAYVREAWLWRCKFIPPLGSGQIVTNPRASVRTQVAPVDIRACCAPSYTDTVKEALVAEVLDPASPARPHLGRWCTDSFGSGTHPRGCGECLERESRYVTPRNRHGFERS
jgi:hypothetical protein